MESRLTETEKEILFLYNQQGLSIKEIMNIRNCGKRNIYKLLRRIRAKGHITRPNKVVDEIMESRFFCYFCDYEDTVTHHIIHKKDGGTDCQENLINICPNCHNKIHQEGYLLRYEDGYFYLEKGQQRIVHNQRQLYRKFSNETKLNQGTNKWTDVDRFGGYLYDVILNSIKQDKTMESIAKQYKITHKTLYRYRKNLKDAEIIEQIGYGVWKVKVHFDDKSNKEIIEYMQSKKEVDSKSSVGARPEVYCDLHALTINIPILSGQVALDGKEIELNNWTQEIKKIPKLQITLTNNNNKSLTVHLWSRRIYEPNVIPNIVNAVVNIVYNKFKQQNIELDYFGWRVTTFHVSIRNSELDSILNKGVKIERVLNRETKKISENDVTQEAKVWIDSSPYKGIETNDLAYFENYMMMPELMKQMAINFNMFNSKITPTIENLAKNIELHLKVLSGMETSFKRFNKLLSQRQSKLGEF